MSAIHFVSQKLTRPFKPLLFASHGFLDVAGRSMPLSASMLRGSAGNVFPYGQCTWWANQRYHQLYGSFVPWRTKANAFQWVNRAVEAGWHVSGTPIVGSIMVLQPNVGGAYGLGHVGVVERVLTDGRVIASSMNWGNHPNMITQDTYVPGPGVSFINAASV
jgi:surface antigen